MSLIRRLSAAALVLATLVVMVWNYSWLSLGIGAEQTQAGFFDAAVPLPDSVTEAGGTTCQGKIFVIGGIGPWGQTSSRVWAYDGAQWLSMPDLPLPTNHPGVVCYDDQLFVVGGFGPLGLRPRKWMLARWLPQNKVWRLAADGASWTELVPMPEPRGAGGLSAAGGYLWYVGGIAPNYAVSAKLFRYDIAANRWDEAPSMSVARDHLRMESVGSSLFAISGRLDDLGKNVSVVERYDISTGTWTSVAPHPSPRGGMASVVWDGQIYTFGGERMWSCDEGIEKYDPQSDRWTTVGLMPEGRHGIIAGVLGGTFHLVSGGRFPRLSTSRIHRTYRPTP